MRLQELFTDLTARKDDSQQRGWYLHEDESIITSLLEELLSILVSKSSLMFDFALYGIYMYQTLKCYNFLTSLLGICCVLCC